MNLILFFIMLSTVLQVVLCKFSLWWFISLIVRILFMLRMIGITLKVKGLAIGEGVSVMLLIVFYMLFHGDNPINWGRLLLNIIFTGLCVLLMYLDDLLYVYTTEDADDIQV